MGDLDIRFYLSIFWRRLPYVIVIATAISMIGGTVAILMPPKYRATASILVESQQIPEQLARSTVQANGVEQIQIIQQRMMTSQHLLELATQFGVYGDKAGLSDSDIVEDMRSRTSFEQIAPDNFRNSTAVSAFSVSFEAQNSELAARVTREIVNLILKENVRLRTDRATDTLQFFEQSVEKLSAELRGAENELMNFKNQKKDALPDSLQYRRSEQSRQQERLAGLEREEAALQERRNSLVELGERDVLSLDAAHPATPEEQMLAGLRKTLLEQQAIYADDSPNITLLRSQISKLESQIRNQISAAGDATATAKPSEYSIRLSEIDGQLASITKEKATLEQSLAELTRSILATPPNEVMLNSIERNYQNLQSQYNSAVAKLADASTGEQIELGLKVVRFSVIEMPTAPEKPIPSKRLAIAGGSVVGGFGAGLGFIILLELLNRSIRRPAELIQALGVEPLATIPYMQTRGEVIYKRTAITIGLLLVGLMLVVSLLTIRHYHLPIDALLGKSANGVEN